MTLRTIDLSLSPSAIIHSTMILTQQMLPSRGIKCCAMARSSFVRSALMILSGSHRQPQIPEGDEAGFRTWRSLRAARSLVRVCGARTNLPTNELKIVS